MRSKQYRTTLLATSVLLSAVCVLASEPPPGLNRTARRLVSPETAAPSVTERGPLSPATVMPAVQVDVYFTQGSPARPVGFQKNEAGELWFLEVPALGYGNLVHLLPAVPADSSFEMNPTRTSVAPDTYRALPPKKCTAPPRRSSATSVETTVSGDSSGAFIRYQIPTANGWACDLEAHDNMVFTERDAAKIGVFDPAASQFAEWDVPAQLTYPVGVLACGDTVFFVEADSCRLGRLVTSDSVITEWDIPGTSYGSAGYPGLDRDRDGDLWLTCSQGPRLLVEIEIGTGDTASIFEWDVPGNANGELRDVAVDSDGMVWYSVSGADTCRIGVLDPAGESHREWRVPGENTDAYYLELDTHGYVWLGENDGAAVARLSPADDEFATYPIGISHGYVYDYALDGDGNVWVGCYDDCALLRFSSIYTGVNEGLGPRDSDGGLVVWPNPFISHVHCPPLLKCSVFDQSGRLVAEVRNGTWDGRGTDGRELRAGVYFVTSGAGKPAAVVKLK
jgi:streptogramin lyase